MINIAKDYTKNVATVSIKELCEVRVMPFITHNGEQVFALVDIYREKGSPYVTTYIKHKKYNNFEAACKAAVSSVKQNYEVKILGMRWRDCYIAPKRKISHIETLHPYFAQ